MAFSVSGMLAMHRSIDLSFWFAVWDHLLSMFRRSVGGVDWVVRVRHWPSGSLVISDLGVRETCVAFLDKNVATRGRRCGGVGGRMGLKEGLEMIVQVLQLLSNLTQGS